MSSAENPGGATAFTTAFLARFGMARGRTLARTGRAMMEAAEAAALPPDSRPDALGEARWLATTAADELDALAEALANAEKLQRVQAVEIGGLEDRADPRRRAALLYSAGCEVAGALKWSAQALRGALDRSPELIERAAARPQAPATAEDHAANLQALYAALAALLRPWAARLRSAAKPIYPPEDERDDQPQDLPSWIAGSVDVLSEEHLCPLIAELEALAELTPQRYADFTPEALGRRADRVLGEIDPDCIARVGER